MPGCKLPRQGESYIAEVLAQLDEESPEGPGPGDASDNEREPALLRMRLFKLSIQLHWINPLPFGLHGIH